MLDKLEEQKVDKLLNIARNKKVAMDEKEEITNILLDSSDEEKERIGNKLIEVFKNTKDPIEHRDLGFIIPFIFIAGAKYGTMKIEEEDIKSRKGRYDEIMDPKELGETLGNELNGDNTNRYNNKHNFVLSKEMFDQNEVKNFSFEQMQSRYSDEHISSLPKHSKKAISSISKQIINENDGKLLNEKSICVVPLYALENEETKKKLIKTLKNQIGDFKVVIYMNGAKNNVYRGASNDQKKMKENREMKKNPRITDEVIDEEIIKLKQIIGGDKRILVVGNAYENKQLMGAFVSDMIDGVIVSCDPKSNPIIHRMDGDLYDIDNLSYIKDSAQKMINDPSIRYLQPELTMCKPLEEPLTRLSEKMDKMMSLTQNIGSNRVNTSGGGMNYWLNDYMKVKGELRDIAMSEDKTLGQKLRQFYGDSYGRENFNIGKRGKTGKVYVSARRAIEIIASSKPASEDFRQFSQQRWTDADGFQPTSIEDGKPEWLKDYDNIVKKLITDKDLTKEEKNSVEGFIRSFKKMLNEWGMTKEAKDFPLIFQKYRNNDLSSDGLISKYKVNIVGGEINFIKK